MAGPGARPVVGAPPKLRLDKWLWQARFFKTRHLAADMVESGHCRINGNRTKKAGHAVAEGDVLTFAQGARVRLIKVLAIGQRRGPAAEAQALYLDLDPKPEDETSSPLE
ncbi:RNA-binding S4 domain-containing protein [Pseudotabrizicola sp. L79]|uniref:RNA-binding S4 domain-containing protein n=1 Tax=Pseudotabrizicola sp. L79 TaxID=3118402 RepID=UPI002F921A6B